MVQSLILNQTTAQNDLTTVLNNSSQFNPDAGNRGQMLCAASRQE